MRKMNKRLSTFAFLALIGLVITCIYLLFTQIDGAINGIQSFTDTATSQKGTIYKTELDLSITKKVPVETESELSNDPTETYIVGNDLNIPESEISIPQGVTGGSREGLQLYDDTAIIVESGAVPPYRANLRPRFNLENNPDATDVSWSELKNFLLEDRTDENPYIAGVYTCGEFAEDLHNNAEMNGIRAAWVIIRWKNNSTLHAINAFKTTDSGLVYIDVNGIREGIDRPQNIDSLTKLTVGEVPYAYLLFPDGYVAGQRNTVVSSVEIYW